MKPFVKSIGVLFLFVLAAGCGPRPDIVSTDKKGNDPYSANDVRRMTVDQPFLISGDYFRERHQENTASVGQLFSKQKTADREQRTGESEQITEDKRRSADNRAPAGASDRRSLPVLPLKMGFLIDQNRVSARTADRITGTIPDSAAPFPVLIVEGDHIRESLAQTDCLQNKDLLCVSKTLSLYPGVRMLALVEQFSIPETYPGEALAQITVVDAGLSYRYPAMEITAQIHNDSDADTFIRGTLQSVSDFSVKKSSIMTPFCRSFSYENNFRYITAGKQSGLKIGDTLQIMSPGTLVKSPGGLPAGWISGKSKGKLRVEQFFGDDFAACTLIEGEVPGAEDMIIIKSEKPE